MKQSPELQQAQASMRPGKLSRDGFLGADDRALAAILQADNETVGRLGITHAQIADRLQKLTEIAETHFGTPVDTEDGFELVARDARGKIPCPWHHPGVFRKGVYHLRRKDTGEELQWTALAIHLIREHGFYQGKGSAYRLEPSVLKKVLGL